MINEEKAIIKTRKNDQEVIIIRSSDMNIQVARHSKDGCPS